MTEPLYGLDRIKIAAKFLDELHRCIGTDPGGVEVCSCGDLWPCPSGRHVAKLKEGIA